MADYVTLLGTIRDKDFIGHDADIDVGTFFTGNQDAQQFECAMKKRVLTNRGNSGWTEPRNAIITTACANFFLILLEYGYIRRYLKVDFKLFDISKLKYLLYSLIFIPVSWLIRQVLEGPIPLFIAIVLVNVLLYGLILIITKDLVLQILLDKVKKRFGKA